MQKLPQFVTPRVAEGWMSESINSLLIDVRSQDEFNKGHAIGAINLSLDSLSRDVLKMRFADLTLEKSDIYLMCDGGNRSVQAARQLCHQGMHNLAVIEGGVTAWKHAHLPMNRSRPLFSRERQSQLALASLLLFIVSVTLVADG